jgi:hypothetical protein
MMPCHHVLAAFLVQPVSLPEPFDCLPWARRRLLVFALGDRLIGERNVAVYRGMVGISRMT